MYQQKQNSYGWLQYGDTLLISSLSQLLSVIMNWNTIQPTLMQESMMYSSIKHTHTQGSVSGLCYTPQKVCHLIDAIRKEYADLVAIPTWTVVGQRSVEKSQVGGHFPAKMIPGGKVR